MKLYEIPRESKIRVDEGIVTMHNLDGQYSYCTCDWKAPNNVCHLGAVEELELCDDGFYKLK